MPRSWKPGRKTGKMMVSWCLSQKLMRRRDVEIMCRVLYPCWEHTSLHQKCFHLLGITFCCIIFPFSDLSLAAEEEWLSCCLFSISAAAGLWASFLSGYHIFYSLMLSKAVGWEWTESSGFVKAKLDCCKNCWTCYRTCTTLSFRDHECRYIYVCQYCSMRTKWSE